MNTTRVTIILLALAAVLVIAMPTIQRAGARLLRPPPPQATFAELQVIAERAHRPELWLAIAEVGWQRAAVTQTVLAADATGSGHVPASEALLQAWQHAVETSTVQSAPAVRVTLFRLHPMVNRIEAAGRGTDTAEEVPSECVDRLMRIARWTRQVDPDNAAVWLMGAWLHAAEGDIEAALDGLAGLPDARRLTTYRGEVALATAALAETIDSPPDVSLHVPEIGDRVWDALLWQTAQMLTEEARQLRREDDHEVAITLYEALLHMARLIRANAHDFSDGYVAEIILGQVSPARDYLIAQDREDLAQLHDAESAAITRLTQGAFEAGSRLRVPLLSRGAVAGALAGVTVVALVLIGVLLGMVLITMRLLEASAMPVPVTWQRWSGLLAVLFAPSAIYLAFAAPAWETQHMDQAAGAFMPLLGIVLWLAGAGIIARRHHETERTGWSRRWSGQLRSIYWPTLAAVVLLMVVGMHPTQRHVERVTAEYTEIAIMGELAYHGIDAD